MNCEIAVALAAYFVAAEQTVALTNLLVAGNALSNCAIKGVGIRVDFGMAFAQSFWDTYSSIGNYELYLFLVFLKC